MTVLEPSPARAGNAAAPNVLSLQGEPRSSSRLRLDWARRASVRSWVLVAATLAVLVTLSQLPYTRLYMDDFILRASLRGWMPLSSRWDLFRFFTGDASETRVLIDMGPPPWFTAPTLKLGFFRPFAALLAFADDALFEGFAPGYLLHSGVWYVALCALCAAWYQRHLPGLRGGIAAVAFSLASVHQQSVAWFAARNALVAATWGMVALLAHERAMERGGVRARVLSVVALSLALASGEASLGAVTILVVGECTQRGLPWGERMRRLWPVFGLTALYLAGHVLLGYGARGSGVYLDPFNDPLKFLRALPERLTVSMGVSWLNAPADLWYFVPSARGWLRNVGLFAAMAGGAWLWWGVRRMDTADRDRVRFLLLAMLAALLPQMAGPLAPRSYTIASIPAYALLSMAVTQGLEYHGSLLRCCLARSVAVLLLLLHVGWSPFMWWFKARWQAGFSAKVNQQQAELDMRPETVETEEYYLLSVPNVILGVYTPFARAAEGLPLPAIYRALSLGRGDLKVTRTSDRSLELEVREGDMGDLPSAELFRDPGLPFRVGERVETEGLSARVLDLSPRGQPRRVEFTTRRSLDDPAVRLFAWTGGHMQELALSPGETRELVR